LKEKASPSSILKQARMLAWLLVALAAIGILALYLITSERVHTAESGAGPIKTRFGGPFTLIGADGRPFSSQALAGKPFALYFGFTRCGDVCPTTLSRMVKLRREAASDQAMRIVFVTIDPANDGPKEVGQYASLFNAPIIGLTGSQRQIQQVKRQFGIHAQPVPNAPMGKEMEHTAIVLLFDRDGQFVSTISPDEPDEDARAKIRKLVA
jgi:protein SCO1/2